MKTKRFDTMSDAFDYCREAGHPVAVYVASERWKLFPSGRAERLPTKEDPYTREGRLRAETGIWTDH